jgi:hypothetical protein
VTDQADQDFLLRFLDGRDNPCPGCGYNLRDLKSPQCPECGQGLTLSLRLTEPRQGALIAGLVGLAAGAGLGGLLLIDAALMILVMRRGGGGGGLDRFIVINGLGFLVHGLGIFLWVRNWNRLRLLSEAVRRLLVILCWALPLAFVILFAAYIR